MLITSDFLMTLANIREAMKLPLCSLYFYPQVLCSCLPIPHLLFPTSAVTETLGPQGLSAGTEDCLHGLVAINDKTSALLSVTSRG